NTTCRRSAGIWCARSRATTAASGSAGTRRGSIAPGARAGLRNSRARDRGVVSTVPDPVRSTYPEVREALARRVLGGDVRDARRARALPQPLLESGKDLRVAAGERFHVAVREIAHPAREPQAPGLGERGVAKAHALNHAGHREPP